MTKQEIKAARLELAALEGVLAQIEQDDPDWFKSAVSFFHSDDQDGFMIREKLAAGRSVFSGSHDKQGYEDCKDLLCAYGARLQAIAA